MRLKMTTNKKLLDKSETNTDNPFIKAQRRFYEWIEKTPTGKFTLDITVGDGGIRGKPKVSMTENI